MNQAEPLVQVIFFLAYLGVFNGLVLSVYFLAKSQRSVSDVYFGFLLLALSVRIGKSVFVYFDKGIDKLVLQVGLSFCIFIGPFLYFYLQSIVRKETVFKKENKILLAILAFSIITIGLIFPYRLFPHIWNSYIIYAIYFTWIAFVMISIWAVKHLFPKLFTSKLSKEETWMIIVTFGVFLITLLYQMALFIRFSYISGALVFTLLFYLLGMKVLLDKKGKKSGVKPDKAISGEIKNALDIYMKEQKTFKNPKLKLEDLAEAVNRPIHLLSQVLNSGEHKGFTSYVNHYRVQEAKELILSTEHLSLDGIGKEAGFNSKSSFYPAFKKITGMTPAQYRQSLKVGSDL